MKAPARRAWAYRSLTAKATLLVVIFLVVPVILYVQFEAADAEKQSVLLRSVRDQGRIMSQALMPVLAASDRPALPQLGRELARFADEVTNVKLLLKPPIGDTGFFYIASWPVVPPEHLEAERERLAEQGVLARLLQTCEGELPFAVRYARPNGGDEIVTSVTPLRTPAGCWAIVTSFSSSSIPGSNLGAPYWATTEIKVAGAVYLGMAILTLSTFWSVRQGLRHFAERARAIRERGAAAAGSFGAQNEIPELGAVAAEFDRMVEVLQNSAQDIRRAAEDNAHAFKTPIAVIRQSLEPLKRGTAADNPRSTRALGLIENSLDRLDGLVASARRLDEATADLINTTRSPVNLSSLLGRLLTAQSVVLARRKLQLHSQIAPDVVVLANEEMIETVIENLLENACSFSSEGGVVSIVLDGRAGIARLDISDSGPGVPAENLPRIFDRYFSHRPSREGEEETAVTHFGIGLWIARRNVVALGGSIAAENRVPNGLKMQVALPLVGTRTATSTTGSRLL